MFWDKDMAYFWRYESYDLLLEIYDLFLEIQKLRPTFGNKKVMTYVWKYGPFFRLPNY